MLTRLPDDLDYARAKGPPADFHRVEVMDAATGEVFLRVLEANAAEGWFIQYETHADGRLLADGKGGVVTTRVERPIIIRRIQTEANAVRAVA